MARFDVKMLGDEALARRLAALPDKVERTVVSKALRTAAQSFATAIKPGVPRSKRRKTPGKHMADTLKVRALKRRKHRVGYRAITGTRAELGIPGDKVYYPAVIEFGSKTIKPLAFVRGPFLSQKSALKARIINEIRDGIARLDK